MMLTTRRVPLGGTVWCHEALEPLLVDIGSLKPHLRNPRNGDITAIAESIRVNGLYRPLYVNVSTGEVLAGNHTLAALLELGAEKAPAILLTVDETQAERILLVDNRSADKGMYDDGLLIELLDEMAQAPGGLVGTGYEPEDLADLRLLLDRPLDLERIGRDYSPGGAGNDWTLVTLRISPQHQPVWQRLVTDADGDTTLAFARLLEHEA